MAGELEPSAEAPPRPPGPKVRTFACPSCAAPLTVRGLLQTDSIACASCGSIIDLTDESLSIISTVQSKLRIEPKIPLGVRGKLFGDTLEVIGFMQRKVRVEGVDYAWREYLLFNPYKGFRWLSEYNGHWTFIRSTLEQPYRIGTTVRYMDRSFEHFQTSQPTVNYVIGEFFWRVQAGERAVAEDYVSPPYILSRETAENEIVWSLGQYVEPKILWDAFQLKTPIPPRVGVFSCQPSPFGGSATKLYSRLGWLLIAAIVIQFLIAALAQNRLVYQSTFAYDPSAAEKSLVTDVFEVPGHTSNVVIQSHADVSNNWIFLNLALIDEESGHAYDFGREVSYYSGSDSDGAWSEGEQTDKATLSAIPAGRYYLRIEPEGPVPANYSIQVYRDVPRWSFFVLAVIALLIPPVILFVRQRYFEVQRWAESDHPVFTSSSDSDDD